MRAGNTSPFIIWTLQRTGGTNLARRLFEASGLPGTDGRPLSTGGLLDRVTDAWKLHEPFNYGHGSEDRPFGFASERFLKGGSPRELDAVTHAVCAHRLPLKHCVEMVPPEVTRSLAMASVRHGYRHVFLYRRNPLDRLLSMEFARRSGVWGPALKGSAAPDHEIFSRPLDVDALIAHERTSGERLEQTWQWLVTAGAQPLPLAYEDIYQPALPAQARERLMHLLHALGLGKGRESDNAFIDEIIGSGDQGTRERYHAFAGIDALREQLAALTLFSRNDGAGKPCAERAEALPRWILHTAVDDLPELCWPDMPFPLGGVVVLAQDAPSDAELRLDGHANGSAHWQLPSPLMAQRFPGARNGSHARFRFEAARLAAREPLALRLAWGETSDVLFRVSSGTASA